MALIKIFALPERRDELVGHVANSVKLVAAAALNVDEMPTTPGGIETVFIEGVDLVGIDYILEIIAVERPNQQQIAEDVIAGLKEVYTDILFSVYFNNINEQGMTNTPRVSNKTPPITMNEAVKRSKDEI